MEMIVTSEKINKTYGNVNIIKDLSIKVERGKIIGLLGVNGAGKTTIMRLLTKIILPDSGNIFFNGEELSKNHLKVIGYMPEERGLYKNMKVKEYLQYISDLYSLDNTQGFIDSWIEKLGLKNVSNSSINELSKGMSQKVQFISTIIHNPKLLILDEPFSGLDLVSSELIEKTLVSLKENNGTTIILSTHRVDHIERFCDHIIIVNHGKIILSGDIKDVKHHFKTDIFSLVMHPLDISDFSDYEIINYKNDEIQVRLSSQKELTNFMGSIVKSGNQLVSFNQVIPSIKSIFINLINSSGI